MTKSSGRIKSSSVPSKAVDSKVSAAAISRLTSDIKRLMTTALDGGKLMGEILSRQFIESNPILAMMYTFTYIYYSAKTYEIRQKTDGFTEKYKDLCKLSAGGLFCKVPPADERSGKGSSARNNKTSRQNILTDREQGASSGHGIPAAAQNSVSDSRRIPADGQKSAFDSRLITAVTQKTASNGQGITAVTRKLLLTATASPPSRKKPFLTATASPPSREMVLLTFKPPSPPPLRTILKLSISF